MSHEIRTPMNAVLGYADLLSISLEDKTQKEYTESLKTSGRGLLTLINGILDLSKIEAGKLELEFNYINSLSFFAEFERIFSLKIAEKGLEFLLDVDSGTPAGLYLDENRLRQVMFNLIGNAIKFTDRGHISVRVLSQNPQFINSDKGKTEGFIDLIIEVEDTGIGITPEFQKEIFNPFTQQGGQQKYGGTGLGLAISQRLIVLMRGALTLESELGKGSTFRIRIPDVAFLRDYEPLQSDIQINTKEIEFEQATVLVADDVQSNRKYLMDALKDTNLNIIEAENGQVAYQIAEENLPDLIITDILMPLMNGFELLEQLKQNEKLNHIPVIAYSASVMKEDKERIHTSEFAGLLIKPVQINELYQMLMNHLPYKSHVEDELPERTDTVALSNEIRDLQGLIGSLEKDLMDTWKTFDKRQPIQEVKEFGKTLIYLGEEHHAAVITRYGEDLANAASSFNIEKILKLLKQYPKLLENLNDFLKQ
ncbi:MAG TPA: hypothetical protein DC042_08085 [Bacteroidales bacterium]|nr:hypothetical protein [Bacteroidales bacterium]